MKELAKVIPIPDEGDSSAAAMDLHLAALLRVGDRANQMREQLQKVDAASMKRAYRAAVERPNDIEQLKQEKKCLEDDFFSLQVKYEKLKEDAQGKDGLIEILNNQVKEDMNEITKWSEKMSSLESEIEAIRQSAYQQGLEDGHRDGIAVGLEKGYKAGYWSFIESNNLHRLLEAYYEQKFEHLWNSTLFLERTSKITETVFARTAKKYQASIAEAGIGIKFNMNVISKALDEPVVD